MGQLSALRRYDLVPPPFFAARGFVSAPLTLSSATFATSVLAIAVVFLARSARFGHSAPATSTSQKKKVKRLPALPRHKTFPKHLEIPKIDSASTKQQQSGKTGREEERRADAGDVRPVTKTHCCLSRRGHRARASPSLGRRRAQGASRPHLPSPVSAAGGQGLKGSILWIANEGVGPIDGSILRGGCSARG